MKHKTEPRHKPSRRTRARRWAVRLTLVCGGFLLAGLMAEVFVVVVYGEQVKFPRHVVRAPWGLRYNQPDSSYWHSSPDVRVHFRINSQGMRSDVDYTREKPHGTKRIVCLGDSFTIGYEVADSDCFARRLERNLRDRGIACEVLNAGVSGFSTAEALLYLKRELLDYDPDLVILSFFFNDLHDNIRSNLFRVSENGQLALTQEEYVPLGGFADFVNTNWLLSFLSERSNAFAFAKERITKVLKREVVKTNLDNLNSVDGHEPAQRADSQANEYPRILAAAILEELYATCRRRDLPLLIQNIPTIRAGPRLVDVFPYGHFEIERPALHFVACSEFLTRRLGQDLLYHERSHAHWTPLSHRLSAERLTQIAEKILR